MTVMESLIEYLEGINIPSWVITTAKNHLIFEKKQKEDFAIGFAEWLDSIESKELIEDLILVGELSKDADKKELLEIYKKEKGL